MVHGRICRTNSNRLKAFSMQDKTSTLTYSNFLQSYVSQSESLLESRERLKKDCKLVYGADFYEKALRTNPDFINSIQKVFAGRRRSAFQTAQALNELMYEEPENPIAESKTDETTRSWKQDRHFVLTVAKWSRAWIEEVLLEMDANKFELLPPWFVYDRQWPWHTTDTEIVSLYTSSFDSYERPSLPTRACNVKLNLQTQLDEEQQRWKRAFKAHVAKEVSTGSISVSEPGDFFAYLLQNTYFNAAPAPAAIPSREALVLNTCGFLFALFPKQNTFFIEQDGYTVLSCPDKLLRARVFPSLRHMDQFSLSWSYISVSPPQIHFSSRTTELRENIKGYVTRIHDSTQVDFYWHFYLLFSFREVAIEHILRPSILGKKVMLVANQIVNLPDGLFRLFAENVVRLTLPNSIDSNKHMLDIVSFLIREKTPELKRSRVEMNAAVFIECMRNIISFQYLISPTAKRFFSDADNKTMDNAIEVISNRDSAIYKKYGLSTQIFKDAGKDSAYSAPATGADEETQRSGKRRVTTLTTPP